MIAFHFKSFKSRMLCIIMGTVLLSQCLTYVLFNHIATQNAYELIRQNLEVTAKYFQNDLGSEFRLLQDNARLLVNDFAFKQALVTGDRFTIETALLNHRSRIDADIMFAFNKKRELISYSSKQPILKQDGESDTLINASAKDVLSSITSNQTKTVLAIIDLNDTVYQVAFLPVLAPRAIAYIGIGHRIDNNVAANIKSIASSDITFFVGGADASDEQYFRESKIVASTLDDFDFSDLFLRSFSQVSDKQFVILSNQEKYISRVVSIPQVNKQLNFFAVVQTSLDEVVQRYTRYRPYFSALTALLLIVAIPVAILIARRITRPIERLVDATDSIKRGEYSINVQIEQQDELAVLGRRVNQMAQGLEEREKMKFMAFHDGLTGLGNRRLVMEEMERILDLNKTAALLMIDLDGFKAINDTYGHDAGDATLIEISKRLSAFKVDEDDLVARLGGDEFLMIFHGVEDKDALSENTRLIIEKIMEPIMFNNQYLKVGASIGISLSKPGTNRSQWMKSADMACYEAKSAGKGTFKFK